MKKPLKAILSLICAATFVTTPLTSVGNEMPSVSTTAEAATKLAAPENVSVSAKTSTSITLKWDAVKGADGYRVYKYDEKSDEFIKYKNVTTTSCKITGLKKNTKYIFKVATLTQDGKAFAEHGITGKLSATTKSSDYPEPPSKNYTGFSTISGKKYYYDNGKIVAGKTKKIDGKIYLFSDSGALLTGGYHTVNSKTYYSDKNGVVSTSKWVGQKKTSSEAKYYYAEKTGQITTYSFKPEGSSSYSLYNYYNLYINDVKATESDLQKINTKGKYTFDCFYKFNNDYYYIWAYSKNLLRVACDRNANLIDLVSASSYMYDFGSGKYLGEYYGILKADSKGVCSGKLFNKDDGYIYTFNGKGKQITKTKAGSLVLLENTLKLNSVGGTDIKLYAVNNSSKTIKYIYYNVYIKNGVGDIVKCRITGDSSFILKCTGPYKSGDLVSSSWKAIMYNYSAKEMVISSVDIEYMDGTKTTLSGSKITVL